VKIYVTAVYFLLYSFFSNAQDLNGFWKGILTMPGGCFPVNNIELQITINGESVYGNSYHYQDINNYVKKKFSGSYMPALKKIILEEAHISTYKIPLNCRVCIKKFELVYSQKGNEGFLTGIWGGYIQGSGADCGIGSITLTRIKQSAFKDVPEIEVDTGQIRLDFYDNAEIDGDSISVLVNRRIVISHQKLSAKPLTVFVMIDLENTFQEVEMVAENLGSIPTNTAILIITAGEKRYQLYLTSTAEKSARVRFVYEKSDSLNSNIK
jgi:hypothetical protein